MRSDSAARPMPPRAVRFRVSVGRVAPPDVNPYAPPKTQESGAPNSAGRPFVYRSLNGYARLIIAALAIMVLADIVWLVHAQAGIRMIEAVAPGEAAPDGFVDHRQRHLALTQFRGLAMLVAVVGFCLFLPRANRNARAFGCEALEFTPRLTAGVFFVPIWNLYKPYFAVKELWQASERHPGLPGQPGPMLLKMWWASYLTMLALGQMIGRIGDDGTLTGELAYLHARQYGCLVAMLAAGICIAMVHQLNARFARRHQALTSPP
jgi:hypothetical protein